MPDWTQYVRDHLKIQTLREGREAEIVEDLARQLEDAYREARQSGATDAEARTRAEQHVTDWAALSRQLARSRRERVAPVDRWARDADDRAVDTRQRLTLGAELRQDLLYGVRALGRHRSLAAVAIISLALGIGANTALFSVMHALLFRPLPVRAPAELVAISDPSTDGVMTGVENGERSLFSYHEFEGLRDRSQTLTGLFAFSSSALTMPVATDAAAEGRRADVVLASGEYFSTLGVDAALGRVFGPDVDRARLASPHAVVSHAFWRERLQQDPNVIGRTIRIRQAPFTIIGVLPASFTGIVVGEAPEIFVPLTMQQAVLPGDDWLTQTPGTVRRVMFLHVAGRLPVERKRRASHVVAQPHVSSESRSRRRNDRRRRAAQEPARRAPCPSSHRARHVVAAQRVLAAAGRADGARRVAAAPRVRQRRQSAARARDRTRARAGGACRARRGPASPRPAAAHREPVARDDRRGGRTCRRGPGQPRAAAAGLGHVDARAARRAARRARARVHGRRHARDGLALWPRAGAPCHASGSQRRAARHGAQHLRRQPAGPVAARADSRRRAGRALVDPARHGRALRAQPAESVGRAARLRRGAARDVPARAVGERLRAGVHPAAVRRSPDQDGRAARRAQRLALRARVVLRRRLGR